MSSDHRSSDPLYIITLRRPDAESLLRTFCQGQRLAAAVENNRIKLFDDRSYAVFNLRWTHGWHDVTVWDVWHKRSLPIL